MERLRSFTRPPPKKEEDLRNEHLKKLSEDRVKNWPNTLAAQRKKKEQWKEIRAAEEEAYRVKVDNEERELREAAAAKAYAKAKYLKFENQDKTKCGRGEPFDARRLHNAVGTGDFEAIFVRESAVRRWREVLAPTPRRRRRDAVVMIVRERTVSRRCPCHTGSSAPSK